MFFKDGFDVYMYSGMFFNELIYVNVVCVMLKNI